eukprot:7362208-Ditylum_brightwellii.AAC.1
MKIVEQFSGNINMTFDLGKCTILYIKIGVYSTTSILQKSLSWTVMLTKNTEYQEGVHFPSAKGTYLAHTRRHYNDGNLYLCYAYVVIYVWCHEMDKGGIEEVRCKYKKNAHNIWLLSTQIQYPQTLLTPVKGREGP